MVDDRKWLIAWAKFDAYRANLPTRLDEAEIARYHAVVKLLEEASGENLSAFSIPESEMKQVPVAVRRGTMRRPGYVRMSDKRYCDDKFFKQQIDGMALYFDRLYPPSEKAKVGF